MANEPEPLNVTVTSLPPSSPTGGPGITSSEFLKCGVVVLASLLSRWLSHDEAVQVASLVVAGFVAGLYAISRGLAKKGS